MATSREKREVVPSSMLISLLPQPFDGQGAISSLGERYTAELESGNYVRTLCCVAYATLSGTSRICAQTTKLIQAGGVAKIIVGLDNGVTSVEAVEQLLAVGAEVWGCEVPSILFHPKLYILSGAKKAWISVGSSNLTARGLFRNVESNVQFSLDPSIKEDNTFITEWEAWVQAILDRCGRKIAYDAATLQAFLDRKALVREGEAKKAETASPGKSAGLTQPKPKKPITLPPLPPPVPFDKSILPKPKTEKPPAKPLAVGAWPEGPRFFAMTLSAFDCSHKTGTPGTPEVSIPEVASTIFPPIKKSGRKYPDAYFNVRVNVPSKKTVTETYRLWQRPPGSATGHADWRINIRHTTMDLTSDGGGDILLFERLEDDETPYEVWVIKPGDKRYDEVVAKCVSQVAASGSAGVKRYGLF
jgi:HKD family nuclease